MFYPRICSGCNAYLLETETNLCLSCVAGLPKTYFWDYDINPIEKLFWGRLKVSSACSFLHFEKESVVQDLMHRFKYERRTGVGIELGRLFALELTQKNWFADVDLIIPIPLHVTKETRRGFNQSTFIADGMAEIFNVPVRTDIIKRLVATETQTRKSRFNRAENVSNVFSVERPQALLGKNVLLIDDVVTTGSTLEAAGESLLQAGAAKLYIATLACA